MSRYSEKQLPNNSIQRTALRAAADAGRSARQTDVREVSSLNHNGVDESRF